MIKVSGEQMNAAGKTITELLDELAYKKAFVAVEINETIVPKADYDTTVLKDGDVCEIVSFVGGG